MRTVGVVGISIKKKKNKKTVFLVIDALNLFIKIMMKHLWRDYLPYVIETHGIAVIIHLVLSIIIDKPWFR